MTPAPRSVAAAAALLLAPALPAGASTFGDVDRGAALWAQCRPCHEIGEAARNKIGPNLNFVFGRKAADVDDFRYSEAMQRARNEGLVWSLDTLDKFIAQPNAVVPGTRMGFPGLSDPAARADVLAWLRKNSDNPRDIPEAPPTAVGTDHSVAPEILAIVGDAEYGAYLASECLTCHRAGGAMEGIPSVTGWPQEDFVVAMHAYKDKVRDHPVMQMMAGRLNNEEIAALAAYFADLGG
ncbi:c-type cytochrome [Tropicimonas isoalkanivorans]|uniref:Cytochrome c n=1 Tax=Tropicimonas isoalkanivorans TaxID=441112 RepID=A0A1I1PEN3_9RHOB|nr:c-type cytochrome [Tropicimonas isoalkanivorans]SFD05533.1 cytochrome c [Tropicimonas isoalkanivorans]